MQISTGGPDALTLVLGTTGAAVSAFMIVAAMTVGLIMPKSLLDRWPAAVVTVRIFNAYRPAYWIASTVTLTGMGKVFILQNKNLWAFGE